MLSIKKIKPIGCKVLVTEEVYEWDDFNAAGVIETGHSKGCLKSYQTVLAVGDDVKFVKPGDVVMINYYKYAAFKEDPNSLKAMAENPIVKLSLDEVDDLVDENGDYKAAFLIDERDVKYILEDYDEFTYEKDDSKLIIPKQPQLILPSKRIKS